MDWRDRARAQAGAIARRQLSADGLTPDEVDGLVRRRDLRELLPGVYAPRAVGESVDQAEWAAVLWSGGVLSHRSAGRRWQTGTPLSTMPDVTVADRRFRGRVPGVRVHRVPLSLADCVILDGIVLTTRARTVIDLLRTERYVEARDLRDRALQRGWLTEAAIERSIRTAPGRNGNAQLRRLLAELERGAQAESERLLHALLRRAGLGGWQPQYRVAVAGRVIYADVAFPRARLIIEVDGRRYHSDEGERFEDDRDRQNALVVAGWRVLRITWRELTDHPDRVISRIVQLLAA